MFAKSGSEGLWLLKQMRPYLKGQVASVTCMIVSTAAALVDPLILKWLIDVVIPRRSFTLVAVAGLLMLLMYLVRTIAAGNSSLFTYNVSQKFMLDLRIRLFKHLTALPADYHDSTPVGSSLFVVRDSLDELGTISADCFPLLLRTLVLSVFSIVSMLSLNVRLTGMMLLLVPLFLITAHHFRRILHKTCEAVQEEGNAASMFLQEHLSSVTEIQLLRREKPQLRKAVRIWVKLARAGYARRKAEYFYAISSTMIVAAGIVSVMIYGGLEVIRGALTLGGLVAFHSYLLCLFEPLYITVEVNSRFQRAHACIHRIKAVLDRVPSVCDPVVASPFAEAEHGAISAQDVSFSYVPERRVLKNINLHVNGRERLALIGPSGCGKSTLARLMARLYDTRQGSILLDGVDIRSIGLNTLRNRVRYLPQQAKLFNATLADNLRYGKSSASWQELTRAAEIAGLATVIPKLLCGWSENLGPGGGILSGGERQRVAIARAVLQVPKVLILDEATSELDFVSEQIVCERLTEFLRDTTIIVISHRLSSLGWVDRILLLANGEIADTGTHNSLYGKSALYTFLYDHKEPNGQLEQSGNSFKSLILEAAWGIDHQ